MLLPVESSLPPSVCCSPMLLATSPSTLPSLPHLGLPSAVDASPAFRSLSLSETPVMFLALPTEKAKIPSLHLSPSISMADCSNSNHKKEADRISSSNSRSAAMYDLTLKHSESIVLSAFSGHNVTFDEKCIESEKREKNETAISSDFCASLPSNIRLVSSIEFK